MDNRGFPTGAPIGEGKGGFPYQAMNGYPGMCYTGQEMVMPYGQYGATGADVQFNEQCAVSQQVPPAPPNMSYGFGSQAHQYMQHYRHQAHIMQAAYSNAQQHNRVTNPQQIADSIYNMAAHAYNYQQHQNPQLSQAANTYSPGAGGPNMLSVRTGQSPANSIHSPAGSAHSIGERPMLSPHVQSNAQIYNYHQPNQQTNSRHTPSQQQQQHVANMNFYSNNNSHTTPAVNGCMNAELDHRRSIERLAAISHPTEQFTHNQRVSSPVHTNNSVSQYYQPAVTVDSTPVTGSNGMAAPTSQHRTELPKHSTSFPHSMPAEVRSPSASNQPSLQSKPPTVNSPGDQQTIPNTVHADVTSAPSQHINSAPKETEAIDNEMKPKETAVDSGIDSEQVDKDNDEEHDTSTTSNKSEPSPHTPKSSDMANDGTLLEANTCEKQVNDSADVHSDSDTSRVADGDANSSPDEAAEHDVVPVPDSTRPSSLSELNAEHQSISTPDDLQSESPPQSLSLATVETSAPTAGEIASNAVANDLEHKEFDRGTEHLLNTSLQQSDLNDSFSSQVSSSLCSSGASKQSMGDESRLPPRKRKQKLSEHTKSLKAAMPLKKRGRPSKEAIRLREAAKFTDVQQVADVLVREDTVLTVPPVKERKLSISSGSKTKKPVHSGALLHSPKLSLTTKEDTSSETLPPHPSERVDNDLPSLTVHLSSSPALSFKSNAVLVSPPRKPKANVNEMEKALMRVVSSDVTGEINFCGKKKRGRPPGSKNRKSRMFEQRARSNSTSSSKSQLRGITSDSSSLAATPHQKTDVKPFKSAVTNTNLSTSTLSQSHKLSLSVRNRTKSLHYRKFKNLNVKSSNHATELKLPVATDQWVCTFCQHISNYGNMGDLFGGYNIQPYSPLPTKVISHKKTADMRQHYSDKSCRPNEIWFHERCIIWSPGVYMLGGKLYGVYEAITAAFQTTCSSCKKKGAILGCFCKGCSQRYHLHCAEMADCALNEENFSMLCTKHKDKKIVLM